MIRLGSVFMLTGATGTGALLVLRSIVAHRLGLEAVGHFSAAWAISMTHLGFVMTAMGVDYLPRLTAVQHSVSETNRTVNEQAEVALLLAVPILIATTALAPWILTTLYSAPFEAAASVLRWQMLGDVFKVAAWPLAFVLLARGASIKYALVELTWSGVLLALVLIGIRRLGLAVVGPAYLVAYVVYFGLVIAVTGHGAVGLTGRAWRLVGLGAAGVASVNGLRLLDDRIALAVGLVVALLAGVASARRLAEASRFVSWRHR